MPEILERLARYLANNGYVMVKEEALNHRDPWDIITTESPYDVIYGFWLINCRDEEI